MRQGEERRVRYRRGSWKSRLERLERETGEAKGSRNGFLIQHEWEMDKKAISKQCHWSGSAALQRKSVDKKWVGGAAERRRIRTAVFANRSVCGRRMCDLDDTRCRALLICAGPGA